jgi:hypothetical protein
MFPDHSKSSNRLPQSVYFVVVRQFVGMIKVGFVDHDVIIVFIQ